MRPLACISGATLLALAGFREGERFPREAPGPPAFGPGGAERDRTANLRVANAALSQLSYGPVEAAKIA